jgi:hypothetical protein
VACLASFTSGEQSVNVPLQSLLGDGILIYRCWIVWNKSWLIVTLPLLIWLANIICAIRLVDLITQVSEGLITGQLLQPWGQGIDTS